MLRARTLLLGSGRLSLARQIEAYRVLAEVSPLTYLPKLSEALVSYRYAPEFQNMPDVQLALQAEAAATARRVDASDPEEDRVACSRPDRLPARAVRSRPTGGGLRHMRFARPFLDWSPDIKQAYFDSLAAVEQEAAALGDAARTDPLGHLPQLVAIHRGLTIRSALYWENRGHRILKPLRPVFDEGVALACRLADLAGAGQGREALGRALTDRSMFLVAAKQYGEAYDDFLEAIALPD